MRKVRNAAFLVLAGIISFATISAQAAISGTDEAGNYTSATFTNGSNAGAGFGPWEFNAGQSSLVGLTNSTAGSGNINSTNDLSFLFYGGTNSSYAEAIRALSSPMIAGDVLSVKLAYNWDGGARGFNVLNGSNGEIFNLNLGGGNSLSYTFQGQGGVTISTDYSSTAVVEVVVQQLSGNQLDVTVTRNDGFSTNFVSTTISSPAAKIKFYNGGHSGDNLNYALFVNDLELVESSVPTLDLSGHDAMAVGMINDLIVTRGGVINTDVIVSVSNVDPLVADVPVSVDFISGDAATNFPISGLALGETTISITADGYPTSSLDVAVYDIGYDDSSYASEINAFTNGGNSGIGFQPWIFVNNDGPGDGYTNFAGTFIGNSTSSGGGNVNDNSGAAFGLYANQQGAGDAPFFNAIRMFDSPLNVGEAVSLEFGVNFRNGSKGAVLQNGGSSIFEIGVFADDYWYINHSTTNGPVSLGWAYAADTAIELDVKHVGSSLYDITIIRRGSTPQTNALGLVDLGDTPNEVRFYIYGTEAGGENNLSFNRLALYTSYELPVLEISGHGGMVVGQTNLLTISRTGPTTDALLVDLINFDEGVAAVTSSVEIGIGESSVDVNVVGISNGNTIVYTEVTNAINYGFNIEVFDVAYDDSSYYGPADWVQLSNGGVGYTGWDLSLNNVTGDGFTNVAGNILDDSSSSAGDVNSSSNNAFAIYAAKEGTGGPDQQASAIRGFASELGLNQKLSVDLGVNFRNGAKGVVLQDTGTWLFEVAVLGDDYWFRNWGAGDTQFTSLGWAEYSADTSIRVEVSRVGSDLYNIVISRSGEYSQSNVISSVSFGGNVPDQLRFYTFLTDGGAENNLYFNRLAIQTIPASGLTDGIPDAWWDQYGVDVVDRIAANDLDGDGRSNWDEYIADTNPDDINVFFPNEVISAKGGNVMSLVTGPSTNSRVYDVWWSTNLLANPQVWTRYGLNVTGDNTGTNVTLHVTNSAPTRLYRTGVSLP